MTAPRFFALVPAAGVGARSGASIPKQYLPLAGKPMLGHVMDTFAGCADIRHTFVVVSAGDGYIDAIAMDPAACTVVRHGGATRQASVLNGLLAMRPLVDDADWVLVHDAARPGLDAALVARLIGALQDDAVGGLLALPLVDTLKRAGADGRAVETVPRAAMWAAQTPQMFRYGLLRRALEQVADVTDEASAIEALGLQPKLVEGSARNLKVTVPGDIALAEIYLKGIA